MRTILITIGLLFFVAVPVRSQFSEIGIHFGPQLSTLNAYLIDLERNKGINASLYTEYEFRHWLSGTIELGYSQRGYTFSQEAHSVNGTFIDQVEAPSRLDYLTITPLIKVKKSFLGNLGYFGVGPRLDYLVQSDPGVWNFSSGQSFKDELPAHFDRWAAGLSFSIGIQQIELHSLLLRIGLGYEFDLTDSLSNFPAKARNNTLALKIGFGIPL